MRKSEVKRALGPKIKFGNSASSCKIGNYLFEDALPLTNEPYQSMQDRGSKKFLSSEFYEFWSVQPTIKSIEFKKERWYVRNTLGRIEEFNLWKRIG